MILLAVVATTSGPALAHNPALTVHVPVPLDGGLFVLGEEGVATLLDLDGTVRWQANELGHLPTAPVRSGSLAVALSLEPVTQNASIIAYDGKGDGWRAPLPDGIGRAHVVDRAGAIWAFGTTGWAAVFDRDGDLLRTVSGPPNVAVAPVRTAEGGWWAADANGAMFKLGADHTVHRATSVGGLPTDVAADAKAVYVAVRGGDGPTRIETFDHGLSPAWTFDVPGASRVGGRIGLLDEGVVFGTYAGSGAEVVRLTAEGELAWRVPVANATAAAITVHDERIFVTANAAVLALDLDGALLWETPANPFLAGALAHDGLVVVPGASNELIVLNATEGRVAWRWSDGIEEVPWTEHASPPEAAPADPEKATGLSALVAMVAIFATTLIVGRRGARP